jgi:hypothetical protein
MKNHQSACAFLLFLTGAMLYGVNTLRNATDGARELMKQAMIEAETSEHQAQNALTQLKMLDSKTAELRLVYNEWKPHFENHRTAQDAEQRIAEVIRDGDVFLISQKFETEEIEAGSIIKDALIADLVVEDDYTKALNWLGRLEESIPSCRITRCEIERGDRGNDIRLVVKLQIPILNT